MTAQFSDNFIYKGKEFSIAGINGDVLFNPYEHGLSPKGTCTACWRGFVSTYAVKNDQLYLDRLDINMDKPKKKFFIFDAIPKINGIKPSGGESLYGLFDYHFEAVELPVKFTGGFLIGEGFIQDLYVHMGFHPAWKYEEVHELIFENGKLVSATDISAKMKEYRRKRKEPGFEEEDQKMDEWIEKCFSLNYNL